jgi:hypothetical protein
MFTHKDDENLRLLYSLSGQQNEMVEYWTISRTFVQDYKPAKPPFILTDEFKLTGKDSSKST